MRQAFKTFRENISEFEQAHGFFLTALLFLALLLFKNPFSENSIIPNLYPYADTIHYINPARSFLAGDGWQITREGRGFAPGVPPLYSLLLVPLFVIYNDPRMFYFANVILAFISLALFYLILLKIIKNSGVRAFLLLLYVTNTVLHFYPLFAMAENLILPLFLLSVYLLIIAATQQKAVIAGVVAVSFYATKYAAAPLTLTFFLFYAAKIWLQDDKMQGKTKLLAFFLAGFLVLFIPLEISEQAIKGNGIFQRIQEYILSVSVKEVVPLNSTPQRMFFSRLYFQSNLVNYLHFLFGRPSKLIGTDFPVWPRFIAVGAWIGFVIGLWQKKLRFLIFALICMTIFSALVVSPFYAFDLRYLYYVIPLVILGFGILLDVLFKVLNRFSSARYFYLWLAGLCLLYLGYVQLNLYLGFSENALSQDYVGVLTLNEFFNKTSAPADKKPQVISIVPPHFIDFYSNGNYELLPMSKQQHFFNSAVAVWGDNDYSDLPALYRSYLNRGYNLYVQSSILLDEDAYWQDFLTILRQFKTELVSKECNRECNLYRLE